MTDLCDTRRVTGLVASDAFDRVSHFSFRAGMRVRAIEKTCHNESFVTKSSNLEIAATPWGTPACCLPRTARLASERNWSRRRPPVIR